MINAEVAQLESAEAFVRAGRYRSVSDLVREALAEKLERLRREDLARQVGAYCESGHADEDGDLIGWQAFAGAQRRAKR